MVNSQNIMLQIFCIIICTIALLMNFVGTGLSNFTAIHWGAVGLSSLGLVCNGLVIWEKTTRM